MNTNDKAVMMIRILMSELRISDKIVSPKIKGEFQPFTAGGLIGELKAASFADAATKEVFVKNIMNFVEAVQDKPKLMFEPGEYVAIVGRLLYGQNGKIIRPLPSGDAINWEIEVTTGPTRGCICVMDENDIRPK